MTRDIRPAGGFFQSPPLLHLTAPGLVHKEAPCVGPVAQLVEQLTFNQWVTGSNPVGLTTEPFFFVGVSLAAPRGRYKRLAWTLY